MANWFYYNDKAEKLGPFNDAQIKIFAQNGTIHPDTYLEDATGKQGRAGKVKALRFPEAAPQPAAPAPATYAVAPQPAVQRPAPPRPVSPPAVSAMNRAAAPPKPPVSVPLTDEPFTFIRRNGTEYGPYNSGQVQQMIQSQKLSPQDEMRSGSEKQWRPAGSFLQKLGYTVAGGVGGFLIATLMNNQASAASPAPAGAAPVGGGMPHLGPNLTRSWDVDNDGVADVEQYDIDGDGVADITYFADENGDGIADVGLDTNGDGIVDVAYADLDGDGWVDTELYDVDGDGIMDIAAMDVDGDGIVDAVVGDFDGDGVLDAVADTDGDGILDTIFSFFE